MRNSHRPSYPDATIASGRFGIPSFRYYALADGIRRLVEALRTPFVVRLVSQLAQLQPNLLDP
jgi:hypothetical protein